MRGFSDSRVHNVDGSLGNRKATWNVAAFRNTNTCVIWNTESKRFLSVVDN